MPLTNTAYRDRNAGFVKIKVLIVDDCALIREGIKTLLETRPDIETVGEAENGQDAYAKVMKLHPDVVLMDIVMSAEDGIKSAQRILRDHGDTKIVILSQHTDEGSVRTAIQAGVSGYLPKTAGIEDIARSIRSVSQGDYYFHSGVTRPVIEAYRRFTKNDSWEGIASLTPCELKIMKLIVKGYTSPEISKMFDVSVKTVGGHRAHLMRKLRVRNSAELTRYAMRMGIIRDGE